MASRANASARSPPCKPCARASTCTRCRRRCAARARRGRCQRTWATGYCSPITWSPIRARPTSTGCTAAPTKPHRTKPNQTKPNQTKPNRTKPNQTEPNQTKPTPSIRYGCPNGDTVLPVLRWVKRVLPFWNASVREGRARHVIAVGHEEGWAEVCAAFHSRPCPLSPVHCPLSLATASSHFPLFPPPERARRAERSHARTRGRCGVFSVAGSAPTSTTATAAAAGTTCTRRAPHARCHLPRSPTISHDLL